MGQCSSTVPCETGCCSTSGYCGFGPEYCGAGNCTNNCDAVAQCGPYAAPGNTLCTTGCCSTSGNCGFGPAYCGAGNCTNSCNAVSECGQYAAPGHALCPLNVCCSEYGFCGTTPGFCGSGCTSGCDVVVTPSCSITQTGSGRRIGYFESWSTKRSCDAWQPEYINPQLWTHINFAFAVIGSDNQIVAMNPYDIEMYSRVTSLKQQNRALKVFISVGGWDAGATMFSNMVATAASRATFISSVLRFMDSYGFDGVDMDWEYPAAPDRGGVAADTANFALFLKEMKTAFNGQYGLTATLPSSYWYMRGFDLKGMEPYVDWFNFMSYDIHGTWDGQSAYTAAIVQPHTNLTEIAQGLELLWRNNISPAKVVLGLAFYGRSFTLADPTCNTVDCPFTSGGDPGPCTGTAGILSDVEIANIIAEYGLTPTLDIEAGVKWITWGGNQWVSYDDADTFRLKQEFAARLCLGGVMVWALDLDDAGSSASALALYSTGLTGLQESWGGDSLTLPLVRDIVSTSSKQTAIGLIVFWTACMMIPSCPTGYNMLTAGAGKVFDFDSSTVIGDACVGGGYGSSRALCIESDVDASYDCGWQNMPGGCQGTCSDRNFLVTQNSWPTGSRSSCLPGGYSSFCCTGIHASYYYLEPCAASTVGSLLSGGLAPTVSNASALAPVLDYYATRQECAWADGSALPGNGLIPVQVPGYWDPEPGKIINSYSFAPVNYNTVKPAVQQTLPDCLATVERQQSESTVYTTTVTKVCDGLRWTQACYHYSSVYSRYGAHAITCSRVKAPVRTLPNIWNLQHHWEWREWVPNLPPYRGYNQCQRDEYPPAVMDNSGFQYLRFIPASDNTGAGSMFRGVCPAIADVHSTTILGRSPDADRICTNTVYTTVTIPCMSMEFANLPWTDDGLDNNECQPELVTIDPGFALLINDEWYRGQGRNPERYIGTIPPELINPQRTAPDAAGLNLDDGPIDEKKRQAVRSEEKRSVRILNVVEEDTDWSEYDLERFPSDMDPESIMVNDPNSNTPRPATDEELWDMFGLLRCLSHNCEEEQQQLGLQPYHLQSSKPRSAPVPSPTPSDSFSKPEASVLGTSHQWLKVGLPQATPSPNTQ